MPSCKIFHNHPAEPVRDRPQGLLIAQPRQQTAEQQLKMTSLGRTAACAASVSTRRTNLLPLAERLLWLSAALSFLPGQVPTHEVSCAAEGNVLACAPTSAITCCADSAPKPGTSASRTTAS